MPRSHAILRSVAWNHAGKVLDFALLYAARVIIARTLGPANDSLFAFFYSLAVVVVLVTTLGSDWLIYKYAPGFQARGERDALAAFLRRTMLLRVVFAVVCAALVFPVFRLLAWESLSRWGALAPVAGFVGLFIVGQNMMMLGTAAFTAMMNTRVVFAVMVSVRAVLVASVALLSWWGTLTAATAIIALAISVALGAVAYIVRLRPHTSGPPMALPVRAMAVFAAALLGNDALSMVLGRQSDILILSYWFPGDARVSIYDNAFQLGMVVEYAVAVGLGGVLFAVYARLAVEARHLLGGAHQRVLQCVQLVYIPTAVIVALLAPGVIGAVYGAAFLPAAMLVQAFVLMGVVELGMFGGGSNVVLLNSIGRERTVLLNRGMWGGLNLAVNLVVIPRYGLLAALMVSRGCSMGAVATEYAMVVRAVGGGYSLRTAAIALGAAGAGAVGAARLPRETLAECVLAGLVMAATVAAVYHFAKPPAIHWALQAVRSRARGTEGTA